MDEGLLATPTVALVGSFRRNFVEIQDALSVFETAGWRVASPTRSSILDEGVEFVRLSTDPEDANDSTIQSLAMAKILRADLTFVVAPDGYVGKTTCYEIGRLIQAGRPIYFSEAPKDLPIEVHPGRIMSARDLVSESESRCWSALHADHLSRTATIERGILLDAP